MEKIYNFWQLIIQIKHNKWWRIMKLFQRARSNKKKNAQSRTREKITNSFERYHLLHSFFLMSCTIVADLSPKICNKCFCKPLLFYSNYHVKIHKDLFTDAFKQEVFALRSKLWWQSFTGLIDWNCLVLSFFENIFCPSTRIMVPVVLYSSAV